MAKKDLNQDRLDLLFRISENVSRQVHLLNQDEEKLDSLRNEIKDEVFKNLERILDAFSITTRAIRKVNIKLQTRIRDQLLKLSRLLNHQKRVKQLAELDIRYKQIYRPSATRKLEEAFWNLFLYQFDAHNIETQKLRDALFGSVNAQNYLVSDEMASLYPYLNNKTNLAKSKAMKKILKDGKSS